MNDMARELRVFGGATPADRHPPDPGRPSDVPETRGPFGVQIEYVAHPSFDDADARDAILAPMPRHSDIASESRYRVPADVRPESACLYEVSRLSREQETLQFRKMNCLKHLAEQARSRLDSGIANGGSSSAASGSEMPARRPWASSAQSWGSRRNGCARSRCRSGTAFEGLPAPKGKSPLPA